jgi:hypothetical protein
MVYMMYLYNSLMTNEMRSGIMVTSLISKTQDKCSKSLTVT